MKWDQGSEGVVRVVTYNVLSSSLCEPEHFVACTPENLDPPVRLGRVQAQLDEQVAHGAVICLQEVSQLWAGKLVPWFEARGYTLITGLYGRKFNGYMGCALAWPTARYESVDVDIRRAADTKSWPPPPPPPRMGPWAQTVAACRGLWRRATGAAAPKPPLDPYKEAARRDNILLSCQVGRRAHACLACMGA